MLQVFKNIGGLSTPSFFPKEINKLTILFSLILISLSSIKVILIVISFCDSVNELPNDGKFGFKEVRDADVKSSLVYEMILKLFLFNTSKVLKAYSFTKINADSAL